MAGFIVTVPRFLHIASTPLKSLVLNPNNLISSLIFASRLARSLSISLSSSSANFFLLSFNLFNTAHSLALCVVRRLLKIYNLSKFFSF